MPRRRTLANYGFSAIPITVALFVVGFVAVIGLYVWSGQATEGPASAQTRVVTTDYLVITEWGVQIPMRDAKAVGYSFIPNPDKIAEQPSGEIPESSVIIKVMPEALQNRDCAVQAGISRFTQFKDPFFKDKSVQLGGFRYLSSAAPSDCGNEADNALMNRVREDFSKLEPESD